MHQACVFIGPLGPPLWAGLARSLPGASWHPLLLLLFWALAVFRLGEGWVILPRPGMLGALPGWPFQPPGSLIAADSAPDFSLKGSWSLDSRAMLVPLARAKEGTRQNFPRDSLLSVSGIVVLLLSNGFVFTSWDMESRDRSGFLLPIGYQKAQSQMSCCFPRTSESGTCFLVYSPHSRLCLAALPEFFLCMFG